MGTYSPIMENQMQHQMENAMETTTYVWHILGFYRDTRKEKGTYHFITECFFRSVG